MSTTRVERGERGGRRGTHGPTSQDDGREDEMFATTAPTLTNAFARGGDLTAKFRKMTVSSSRTTTGKRAGLVVESTWFFAFVSRGCARALAGG